MGERQQQQQQEESSEKLKKEKKDELRSVSLYTPIKWNKIFIILYIYIVCMSLEIFRFSSLV